MINGNAQEFVDRIYSGQDTVFIFHGTKYWFQGYTCSDGTSHMEVFQLQPLVEDVIWQCDDDSQQKCLNAFLMAPIFEGISFWEAEQEIEWVDE